MTDREERGLPSVARFEEIMDAGRKALRAQRWKEALCIFQSATALKPQCVEALLCMATAFTGLEDLRGALRSYRDAIDIDPRSVESWEGLIEVLHQARMFKEEAEACDCLLRISPRMDEALLNKGVAFHALGKLEKALECFDQLIARRPEDVAALNNKGAVLLRLGRLEEALSAFDLALARDPQRDDVQRNRCLALLRLGRYSEAVRAAAEMLAVQEEGWLWMLKGLAHAELRELPLALESLVRAQQLSPGLEGLDDALTRVRRLQEAMAAQENGSRGKSRIEGPEIIGTPDRGTSRFRPQGMAVVLGNLGFPTEALRVWQDSVDKDKPEDWLGLARALYAGGEKQAAERCLREAWSRGGGDTMSLIARTLGTEPLGPVEDSGIPESELGHLWREANALVKDGGSPAAINMLTRLLDMHNDLERGWNWLGVLKALGGNPTDAREAFRKATSANSNYATAWSNLGAVMVADGNLEDANLALRMALGNDPRHADALHNLGVVELQRGHPEEARKVLRQALGINDRPQTWFVLANVMEALGLWREAARCYERSLESGSRNKPAVAGLTRARARMGARKKALVKEAAHRLENIPGIGPGRALTLARAGYLSPAAIRSASIDELAELPSFNRLAAMELKKAVSAQKRKKGTPTPESRR